jgi:hypothetical protein
VTHSLRDELQVDGSRSKKFGRQGYTEGNEIGRVRLFGTRRKELARFTERRLNVQLSKGSARESAAN